MKFSLKKKNKTESSLDITVSSEDIEKKVSSKLSSTQKSAKIKGFRKGKAPMNIVSKMYGPEIRQDVIYDSVISLFYSQVQDKGLKPVGRPNLLPQNIEEGKDIKFRATFETYPEVKIANLKRLSYKKTTSSIEEDDLDRTIINLQKRMSSWEPSKEASTRGDQVKIDFVGTIHGKEFDGNKAADIIVEIGSKSMIEGFEDGLISLKKGDTKILELKFPKDYMKTEIASKEVEFDVSIKEVLKPVLCELNSEFFLKTGIDVATLEEYRVEIKKKLENDLENLIKNKIKQSLFKSLIDNNPFEIPKVMVDTEINNIKKDTANRLGIDSKDLDDKKFPLESLENEADKRVRIGILLNQIIEDNKLKPNAERVKEIIQERASVYKEPQQVINWFYSDDEQLRNIEAISLEEQVVDLVMNEAQTIEEKLSYEECVNGN